MANRYLALNYESLTANGTTIASTTVCSIDKKIHRVGTCTSTAYAIRLGQFVVGNEHLVVNNGAYPCAVFPLNSSSNINGITDGTHVWIAGNGGSATFVVERNDHASTPILTYRMLKREGVPTIDLTAATTVRAVDSPAVYTLDSAAGAYTVTMPAPTTRGLHFEFIVAEDTPTNAITINCGAGLADGSIIPRNGTAIVATGLWNASQNVVIGTSALIGSLVVLHSTGVYWCVSGSNPLDNATAAITAT